MKTDTFTKLKWIMLFILMFFASMAKASITDTINSINGPTSIKKGQNITVNIDYETEDKDLICVLQAAKFPWTTYDTVIKHSNEDGKQIQLTVPNTISSDTPLHYVVYLTKKGKDWDDRVSVKYQENIVLEENPTNNNTELIYGGENENGALDKRKWSYFGNTYGQQSRTYKGKLFIYSTPKDVGSGMYQEIPTEIGREYEVSAILIGSDTNRKEQFNGESYLTISSAFPTQSKDSVFEESEHVTGGVETKVSFRFTAISSKTYLALRSDKTWHYASARAISVKAVGQSDNYHSLTVVNLTDTLVINKDNQTIENTHFICSNTNFEAIKVSAHNTLIKGNLFENCATGIVLSHAFNTRITGNRFKHLGAGIIGTAGEDGSVITYNEFVDIGSLDCTVVVGGENCNIYGARENSKNSIFSHNRIDNRGSNARYMEDYISFYTNREGVQNMKAEDNILVGSLVSSSSGACMLVDGQGSTYAFRRNQCYNVSGYGFVAASSKDVVVEDNLIYMDREHVENITYFNSNIKNDGSYTFGATPYYDNVCAENVTFLNNKGYNYTEDGKETWNIGYGWQCLSSRTGDAKKWSKERLFSLEGEYANNIVLYGNQFFEEDPHWEIPSNLFDNLDSNYFSGNTH